MNTDQTTSKARVSPKYTLEDVGCYVDGARGIHAIQAIFTFVNSHGCNLEPIEVGFENELEDECDAYMNASYAVEGAYWGRNENGDWGLWEVDDYSQHAVEQPGSELDRAIEQVDLVRWPKSDPFIAERERDNAKFDQARVEYDQEEE